MLAVDSQTAFSHVTEQQVEDAAFLWLLWDRSSRQPHQTLMSRAKLERRISAHWQGLAFSPDIAWDCALEAGEHCDAGELFVLAMLALSSGGSVGRDRLRTVINLARAQPHTERGLISALGWQRSESVYPWLKPWVMSDDHYERYLAIAACSVRRLDPEAYLVKMLRDPANREKPALYARLLRLVGELKRTDLIRVLAPALEEDGEVGFWAHWSATMLGEHRACDGLRPFVMAAGANRSRAVEVAFRVQPGDSIWGWLNQLIHAGEDSVVIQALGALGDPRGVNWLLARMEEPALAKPAAEAFTLITGVDLEAEDLTQAPPAKTDGDDDAPSLDYDHCPYPSARRVSECWYRVRSRFVPGQRYLMGRPVAEAPLETIWQNGRQLQRRAAALEGALASPSSPYPNASAPLSIGGGV